MDRERCPKCGSTDLDREHVDVGVGTQRGPHFCNACGWSENDGAGDLEAFSGL